MKKSNKSKDHNKSKQEESKVSRTTRKRRKSESSESESEHKKSYHDKHKYDDPKNEKELDNVRSTRHSKRIFGNSDDSLKEEKSISLTLKIEKSGSKDRSPKKRDSSECSKHKAKEANLWKVKSSNGKGAGEIQKLKICRQRTPEPVNMELSLGEVGNKIESISLPIEKINNDAADTDNILKASSDLPNINKGDSSRNQMSAVYEGDTEDIYYNATKLENNGKNIPEADLSSVRDFPCSSSVNTSAIIPVENSSDNESTVETEVVMPTKPSDDVDVKSIVKSSDDVDVKTTLKLSDDVDVKSTVTSCDDVDVKSTVTSCDDVDVKSTVTSCDDVDVKSIITSCDDVDVKSIVTSCDDVDVKSTVTSCDDVGVKFTTEAAQVIDLNYCSNADDNSDGAEENNDQMLQEINLPSEHTVNRSSDDNGACNSLPNNESNNRNNNTICTDSTTETLSTNNNNYDENSLKIDPSNDKLTSETDTHINKEESSEIQNENKVSDFVAEAELLPEQKLVNKLISLHDEEYDYDETDDTEEEGEIQENDTLSPASQVYRKLPKEDRLRNWGICDIFVFNKTLFSSTEELLKGYNIEKIYSTQKDIMSIDSDADDLIFVKEIREENVIHEVESETGKCLANDSNNTVTTERNNGETEKEAFRYERDNTVERTNKEVHKGTTSQSNNISTTEDIKITFNNEKAIKESDKNLPNHRSKESKKLARSPEKKNKHDKHSSRSQKNVEQSVLSITNLVRPFTLAQLKELLQRTGKIVHDGFWIDSIKSKCYVQYETVDQAVETRYALNGIHWPVNNPKALSVRYATQDDMLKAQTQTDITEIPRKTEPLIVRDPERRIEFRNRKYNEDFEDRPLKARVGVREWDIGKPKNPEEMAFSDDQKKSLNDEREKRNQTKRARKSLTPNVEQPIKKVKKPEEREARSLDELFRRTKITPSVYWLPLTDEQIAEKEALRRNQMELIKQRISKTTDKEHRSNKSGDDKHYSSSKRR